MAQKLCFAWSSWLYSSRIQAIRKVEGRNILKFISSFSKEIAETILFWNLHNYFFNKMLLAPFIEGS